MADMEKVITALEFCADTKPVETCFGKCPYAVAYDDYRCGNMKLDALELLKQYSGLAKALEQSNAVNEHLSAEIERLKLKDGERK